MHGVVCNLLSTVAGALGGNTIIGFPNWMAGGCVDMLLSFVEQMSTFWGLKAERQQRKEREGYLRILLCEYFRKRILQASKWTDVVLEMPGAQKF